MKKVEIKISKQEVAELNKMLFLTGKELYDKYGYKEDETFSWTAHFGDEIEADVKLVICGEDDYPYCEAVLFDHGSEVACTEIDDTIDGPWEFEYQGETYIAEVLSVDKESIVEPMQQSKDEVELEC